MLGHEAVIDAQRFIKGGGDCRHHAAPFHCFRSLNPDLGLRYFICHEALDSCLKDRWTHRFGTPSKKKFHCSSADASLTWTHTASRVQLCLAPVSALSQAIEAYVLAAADKRILARELLQFWTQDKCNLQRRRKLSVTSARWKQPSRLVLLSCGCKARDLSFDNGEIDSADAGRLSGAIDICRRSLLQFTHGHESILNLTTERDHEFQIGNQIETAGQIVAFDLESLRPLLKHNAAQPIVTLRLDWTARKPIRKADNSSGNS